MIVGKCHTHTPPAARLQITALLQNELKKGLALDMHSDLKCKYVRVNTKKRTKLVDLADLKHGSVKECKPGYVIHGIRYPRLTPVPPLSDKIWLCPTIL